MGGAFLGVNVYDIFKKESSALALAGSDSDALKKSFSVYVIRDNEYTLFASTDGRILL